VKTYIIKKKMTLRFIVEADNEAEAMAKASDNSTATDCFLHDYWLNVEGEE